eukprot:Gb_04857 [translate_table: standard]
MQWCATDGMTESKSGSLCGCCVGRVRLVPLESAMVIWVFSGALGNDVGSCGGSDGVLVSQLAQRSFAIKDLSGYGECVVASHWQVDLRLWSPGWKKTCSSCGHFLSCQGQ